jgi:hypothetical protein
MGTRRPSKAQVRRMVEQRRTESPLPPMEQHIIDYIDNYTPREINPKVWKQVRPFVIDTLRRYAPERIESGRQRLTALAAYAAWAHERGYELSRKQLLDVDLIEGFTASADLGKSAAANYRSRLRGIARKLSPSAEAQAAGRIAHQAVKPPYPAAELAAIERIARTQPSPRMRRQMCICVGLGFGAGLDSQELKPMRGRNCIDHGDVGIKVEVPGAHSRIVWVRRRFEPLVRIGLEGVTPGRLLLGQDAKRRNVAAKIFANAHILGDAPHFEQSRMRTTWLATLLADGVPLPVIMDAAGLRSARTLTDLVPHVAVDGDHVARLRGVSR